MEITFNANHIINELHSGWNFGSIIFCGIWKKCSWDVCLHNMVLNGLYRCKVCDFQVSGWRMNDRTDEWTNGKKAVITWVERSDHYSKLKSFQFLLQTHSLLRIFWSISYLALRSLCTCIQSLCSLTFASTTYKRLIYYVHIYPESFILSVIHASVTHMTFAAASLLLPSNFLNHWLRIYYSDNINTTFNVKYR